MEWTHYDLFVLQYPRGHPAWCRQLWTNYFVSSQPIKPFRWNMVQFDDIIKRSQDKLFTIY